MKHAIVAIEDRRFYDHHGVDLRGIGARARAGRRRPAAPSRAARRSRSSSSRSRSTAQDERTILHEAARGRARLPPHAQVVEGEDPHRVPQLDLLRQRRLRDRVGRAHVLRQDITTTAAAAAAERCASELTPARGRAARRRSSPRRRAYDPVAHPVSAPRAARPRAAAHARAGLHHAASSTTRGKVGAAAGPRRRPARPKLRHVTARAPATSSSWVASRLAEQLRRAARLRGRPAHPDDARRQAAGARPSRPIGSVAGRPGGPPASLVAIDNGTGEVRAMVGGEQLRRARRSTSPRRASASPARRSSRSCSPRRCSAGSARARSGRRAKIDVHRPQDERRRRSSSTTTRTTTRARRPSRTPRRFSDNSVYAQVGIKVGHQEGRAARQAAWASARRSRATTR